ncbi:uncharacterized protein LOC116260346 [Nymphaea colorata]|nr:uncharacterized protein LOC116260346 [Nymphaea colorata]XP_031494470.1 uncharacterized protein LOC116260346 [Nymphaea colorata]XP_031494471.1 uncharacterized protein LOC116260346 [Nymphaea colorata]XP_031494472.1 uncharacterized protein LOC116260346 [Nymphaea colorata]XP_031494473.1 uncharacterized protein LOC116260346 [Nymphaea colorata]XP_049935489.1 uncharacterized protein LOC116260346 [Nymphaea colorata]XP_049935490.1 uncharacterized protein LOC116260346 [Nymphaea colorata]
MAEEIELSQTSKSSRKRKLYQKTKQRHNKSRDEKEKPPKVKVNKKLRKLYKKRAAQYNSDDDDDADDNVLTQPERHEMDRMSFSEQKVQSIEHSDDDDGDDSNHSERDENSDCQDENDASSEDDRHDSHSVLKFSEGSHAFRRAFLKIMQKNQSSDLLGPVLSGLKNLIAKKLSEEEEEQKVKVVAKKERHLIAEKGHVKPEKFLDSREKFLVSVATKGVVKLFNAVNKAQVAHKSMSNSKSKDAREAGKRSKETFLTELRNASMPTTYNPSAVNTVTEGKNLPKENASEPGWSILRDSYMLTNPKLKDWNKMQDTAAVNEPDKVPLGSSSDEE